MRHWVHLGLLVLSLSANDKVYGNRIAEKSTKVLGKTLSVKHTVTGNEGVETATELSLFGKKIELAKTSVHYQIDEDHGPSFQSDFYVNGRKILAHGYVSKDGSYAYTADIPAAEISGDVFTYSLGILSLGINSGITYDGQLQAYVSSDFLKGEVPTKTPDTNLLSASAHADLLAKGYIEGQVKVLFIKGGVGGAINLVEGESQASVAVTPANIDAPEVSYQGVVHLLSGELYGYIGSGRKKWLTYDFYRSNGHCYSFGTSSCPR